MQIPMKNLLIAALVIFVLKITVLDPLLSKKNQTANVPSTNIHRVPASE